MDEKKARKEDQSAENSTAKPDPETLHTTDPQKNMEGPVSSLMHETGEAFDSNKTEEQANREREENM